MTHMCSNTTWIDVNSFTQLCANHHYSVSLYEKVRILFFSSMLRLRLLGGLCIELLVNIQHQLRWMDFHLIWSIAISRQFADQEHRWHFMVTGDTLSSILMYAVLNSYVHVTIFNNRNMDLALKPNLNNRPVLFVLVMQYSHIVKKLSLRKWAVIFIGLWASINMGISYLWVRADLYPLSIILSFGCKKFYIHWWTWELNGCMSFVGE